MVEDSNDTQEDVADELEGVQEVRVLVDLQEWPDIVSVADLCCYTPRLCLL